MKDFHDTVGIAFTSTVKINCTCIVFRYKRMGVIGAIMVVRSLSEMRFVFNDFYDLWFSVAYFKDWTVPSDVHIPTVFIVR